MLMPTFYPAIGGAEFLAAELAKGLAKRGFLVDFVAPAKSVAPESWRGVEGIRFYPILNLAHPIGIIASILRFVKFQIKRKALLIHAHYVLPTGLIALPVVTLRRIPLVITSPSSDIQVDKRIAYGDRRKILNSILSKIVLRLCSTHVVLCRAMIPDAIAAGSSRDKIRVIYPGIHDPPEHTVTRPNIIDRLSLRPEDFVILFLGRLAPQKAPTDLIEAAPRIFDSVPRSKIVIAGHGELRRKLESLVGQHGLAGRIKFPGIVNPTDKDALLQRCDIFVIPSVVEGMPHLLLEALALGKPIVTTDIPSFREVLLGRKDTLLVPVQSPDSLAQAIIQLARSMEAQSRPQEAQRKNDFPLDRMVEGYVALYEEFLQGRNAKP